ncbi:MAG: hypothetical protein IJV03_00835 [Alphaproteobacteria bacterium]|nr:hypothetical protein [Alphaproteobacteria bacterium]
MNNNDISAQITKMYQELLLLSGVHYKENHFFVFNSSGVLFDIHYDRCFGGEYEIDRSPLLMAEYKKRNLDTELILEPDELYSWVNFQYEFYKMFTTKDKNPDNLFNKTLPHTNIVFNPSKNFETYRVFGMEFLLYEIGYNPTTKKYGIKKHDQMKVLYETLGMPISKQPDYVKLYKRVKDMYMAQCVMENIQHIDEI